MTRFFSGILSDQMANSATLGFPHLDQLNT